MTTPLLPVPPFITGPFAFTTSSFPLVALSFVPSDNVPVPDTTTALLSVEVTEPYVVPCPDFPESIKLRVPFTVITGV